MAKNYAALARSVIAALGGVDNISAVTHCMTRLRFVIKDDQLIDSPTLKTIPGVLGVVRSDNQCQVIIGNTVSQAFQEVVSLLPGDMQPAQPVGKPKLTLRRIGAGILDALIGTMSPLIPAIIVCREYLAVCGKTAAARLVCVDRAVRAADWRRRVAGERFFRPWHRRAAGLHRRKLGKDRAGGPAFHGG